ncbi:zinc-binding dehydrogenase [Actinopolymorpha singaporensis]|uniref:S-(Hydroxymethyl)glutathione dehydrogenase / alcohol dehydrogenase n=1 Tax=Actinopolymorpha singaporensis TaxID=117157 RepID=A0A1H1RD51_9ACTN|nr:Zn-dependent alcohol dehydrogenase [Actinopolymorpha singaporensis]SDS33618.1 S-(hydroxymethyl)glutathione dehydrogenase / alcohol dehydrogenase [Actinopolymorpha singaporensis]
MAADRMEELSVRAAVLDSPGTPLRVEELSLQPPRAGEVLVRVTAAGLCHTDLHYLSGDLACTTPIVPGHEGAGVVEQVGAGVTSVRPGDSVVLMWRPRCGRCAYCSSGRPALCDTAHVQITTNGLLDGTTRLRRGDQEVRHLLGVSCFAERCVVAEQSVIRIPDDIPPRIASLVGCAVITGVGSVLNVVTDAARSGILVIGAGGVGLSCVLGGRLAGAYPLIVADVVPRRLELAARLGATHTIDSGRNDLGQAVREICPEGVDWALEAVGRAPTLEQAVACLRKGGTLVAIGLGAVGATFEVPINQLVQQEKRLVGSLYGSANTVTDVPKLLELYKAGRLPLEELVGPTYPLSQVNDACQALVDGAVGRIVLEVDR